MFGGICGLNSGAINYCYELGQIKILGYGAVSFGRIAAKNDGTISNCYSSGVLSSSTSIQSELGWITTSASSSLSNCFYTPGVIQLNKSSILDWNVANKILDLKSVAEELSLDKSDFCTYGLYNAETGLYDFEYFPYDFGVINQNSYDNPVTIKSNDFSAKLNNEIFSGTLISEIGKYKLEFEIDSKHKKIIYFTIKEQIDGIVNGGVYELTAKASFKFCACTIDDESYESGVAYTKIGNHVLNVLGTNGYSNKYTFTIVPVVNGLENGKNYTGNVSFNVFREDGGIFWLDGNSYKAHTKNEKGAYEPITQPGIHTLIIRGSNDYELCISFSVGLKASVDQKELSDKSNVFYDEVEFNLSYPSGVIDENHVYKTGQKFGIVGNHVLKVYGTQGLVYSYPFLIKPRINGVENGKTYDSSVTIRISKGSCILDGKTFPAGEDYYVSEPGKHTIVITGANNYEEIIDFKINFDSLLSEKDDAYSYDFSFSGGSCYLDNNVFCGGIISEIGHHQLKVIGTDGVVYCEYNDLYVKGNIELIPIGTYKIPPVVPTLNAQVYLDGKAVNLRDKSLRVEEKGEHILRVVGVNFDETYKFSYANPAYQKWPFYVCGAFLSVIVLAIAFLVRNRKRV